MTIENVRTRYHRLVRLVGLPTGADAVPQRWHCQHCNGKSYENNLAGRTADGEPIIEAKPCVECYGTGLVCPICRGLRKVKTRTDFDRFAGITKLSESRYVVDCPGCMVEGKHDRFREGDSIEADFKAAAARDRELAEQAGLF